MVFVFSENFNAVKIIFIPLNKSREEISVVERDPLVVRCGIIPGFELFKFCGLSRDKPKSSDKPFILSFLFLISADTRPPRYGNKREFRGLFNFFDFYFEFMHVSLRKAVLFGY